MNDRKQLILTTVDDLVSNFLYYDRKEDEELPRGAINDAIRDGELTVDEIVEQFKADLRKGLSYAQSEEPA